MNAFARIGRTCVSMLLAGGLSAVALVAGSLNPVEISLPHAVEVGSAVLPAGNYTLSRLGTNSTDLTFVIRPENGDPVTLQARRVQGDSAERTRVEFSTGGDSWHFEKLFIEGEYTSYEFVNAKPAEK